MVLRNQVKLARQVSNGLEMPQVVNKLCQVGPSKDQEASNRCRKCSSREEFSQISISWQLLDQHSKCAKCRVKQDAKYCRGDV